MMSTILATAMRPRRLLSNGRITSVRSLSVGLIRRASGTQTMRCNGETISSGGRLAQMSFRRSLSTVSSLPLASSSLGIFDSVVLPHLDSLSKLPEVSAALANPSDKSTIEGLTRAIQIFESMGGPLHAAVQGLLADAYQQTGQYKQAVQVLEQLLQGEPSPNTVNIQLGLSKALFYDGDFERALGATSDLLDLAEVQSSVKARGTALCAQGIIRLVQLNKDDSYEHAQEVIKVLRVAAKSLEPHGDAGAAAYNNLGVAQIVSELLFLDLVRVDSAMSCLHQGLDMSSADNDLVKGRIYSNMAHALLMEDDDDDDDMLKLASEYSREALSIYEKSTQLSDMEKRAGLGRSLNLVASCYVRADDAVTAEGLFQTAIDMPGVDPLTMIARREVYRTYSDLCQRWDKRQADKERLEKESVEINDSLAEGWKDKPEIISGLVFSTM